MSEQTTEHPETSRYDWGESPTAQDVLDAMRVAVASARQSDPGAVMRMVEEMLEWGPETPSPMRGLDLLLRMISDGVLRVELK